MNIFIPPPINRIFFVLIVFLVSTFLLNAKGNEKTENSALGTIKFIPNKGQFIDVQGNARPDLLYCSEANGMKVFLKKNGISYVIYKEENEIENVNENRLEIFNPEKQKEGIIKGHRVDVEFIGFNSGAVVEPFYPSQEYYNYYTSANQEGITTIHAYRRVISKNIYPLTDVVFYSDVQKGFKYDFIIKPGGNPDNIKLHYTGYDKLELTNGKIKIQTSIGELGEWMPRVYQNISGKITDVSANYVQDGEYIKIKVGKYNPNYELIIDPWITYLGGSGNEAGNSIDANASGCAVVGNTTSLNFPLLGAFQLNNSGSGDVFVSKFNTNGSLLWSTYFGGSANEWGYAIAMNILNEVFITGTTASNNLPGTTGNFQPAKSGGNDFYIAKLSPTGTLSWATYYGGSANEYSYAIATNLNNDVVVTGYTASGNFPLLAPYQNFNAGGFDAFIVKFSTAGVRQWATYVGGSSMDIGNGITVDGSGNIIFSGQTGSGNFPTLNAIQPLRAGAGDIFITKFSSAGALVWSTFYGGTLNEEAGGIAHDNNGNIAVCGYTASADFPATAGAYQSSMRGGLFDLVLIKVNSAGTLAWATYFGGTGTEEGSCIAIDSYNSIYITGDSYGGIPTTLCSYQPQMGGDEDNFLAKFSTSGSLICSGYIGGAGHEEMHAKSTIAEYNGLVYLTGSTNGFYPVTPGAFQTQHGGGTGIQSQMTDAFVAVICGNACGEKMNLLLNFAASQQTICTGQSVSFTPSGSMCDTTGTRYEWYFSGGTPSFSSLQNPASITYNASGIYPVKLVVRTPCGNDSLTKNAYITVNGPLVQLSQINQILCNGQNNGSIMALAQSGTGVYTYQWLPSGGTNSTANNLSPATYTVIVSDGSGCTASASAAITQPPLLQAFVPVQTNQNCFGENNGSAIATGIGGILPYTYQWSSIPSQSTQTMSSIAAGTYTVTITDANGCTANASVTITEPPLLTVVAAQQAAVKCNGQNNGIAVASANGGTPSYVYSWNTGQSTSTASGLNAGNYTVTVTDNLGCTGSATITISEPAALTPTVTTTPEYCMQSNGSATANTSGGTPAYSYNWNTGNSTASISGLMQGVYSLTITDNNGCTTTAQANINHITGVIKQLTGTTQPLCNGSCNGTATINGAGGNPPYNYLWNTLPAQNTSIATGLCAGVYTATITDANNCKDTIQVQLSQPPLITSTVTTDSVKCFGENNGVASVVSNGGTPGYSYSWSNGASGQTQNNLLAGIYTVTVTDANGCTSAYQTTVHTPTKLMVATSPQTSICNGKSTTLTAQGNGGTPGYFYLWSTGQNTSGIAVQPTTNTNYTVSITDKNGCTALSAVSVSVSPLPDISFSADKVSGCGPLCVTLTNTTPNTYSLTWNFGDNTAGSINTPEQHCYTNAGSFNVSLIVTDNNGCSNSLTQNNYITVFPNPVANFSSLPQPATIVNPTVSFNDLSSGATSWFWSFGEITNPTSTQQNPQYTYADTGSYAVTLIVNNEFGCSDTITDYIKILQDFIIYVPNTFSPNGDNKNEIFIPVLSGINPDEYKLLIFDRWGIQIYETNSPLTGWNGKVNGTGDPVQIDTYVWKLYVRDINSKRHNYVGHVNVIR